jgi:hypothetical protein
MISKRCRKGYFELTQDEKETANRNGLKYLFSFEVLSKWKTDVYISKAGLPWRKISYSRLGVYYKSNKLEPCPHINVYCNEYFRPFGEGLIKKGFKTDVCDDALCQESLRNTVFRL